MADSRQNGQLIETSYFDNTGGLNISDSPFKVLSTQATGGSNYEYTQTGGIQKRRGLQAINTVPDTQLKSRGLEIFNTTIGTKTVIRSAERKIQAVDTDAVTFTNLTQDTIAAGSDVFPASTSITTVFAQFNTDLISRLNFAGGTDGVYSVYSPTKYTKNGAVAPAGSISATTIAGGGAWTVTGTYTYAVSFSKTSTDAESNATLDKVVTVAAVTNSVVITLSAITSVDSVTYNQVNIYRSAVSATGANQSGFTVGDLVATVPYGTVSYTDTGGAALLTENVPRVDSVILDNSTLPTGTYNVLATWKRRLVTATSNVLRFSELNSPEAWPTVNTITVPSGGPITGLAVIAFNTDFGNDEYLAVFKERELWLVKGNDYTDVTLSFIDTVGSANQSLVALANGFLTWIDYRGIYLWDGSGKPIYTSRPIEPFFQIDGDLDKTQLQYGYGQYFRNRNMVYWYVSSKINGVQKFVIKMDLRLTLPAMESILSGRIMDGVFITETLPVAIYAAKSYLPNTSQEEVMLVGDDAGIVYLANQIFSDAGVGIAFSYTSPFLDMTSPNVSKRFLKVIAWVDAVGTWDLTLDYWAGYRASLTQKSTLKAPLTTQAQNATALWDVAYWDQALWDDYTQSLSGVVFNLNNDQSNSEGDCLRLNFRNSGVDQPVTIYGYTVIWTEKALSR